MELIVDTTVLIDLWRCAKSPQRLEGLKDKCGNSSLLISWITEAEFARGAIHQGVERDRIEYFLNDFIKVTFTQDSLWIYAQTWSLMAKKGVASDYPDLWIAASALERKCGLLTRNEAHFDKVPELRVVSYRLG